MLQPPYATELKPYGEKLLDLGRRRSDVVCLSGDLTRQCEVDLFRDELPDRFIHGAMAEANMVGVAAALARTGLIPFVHSFGVFTTRRPYDQIVNAVAYPALPVRLIGFMPGVSSPGGPSHQAIDDVGLMRGLPNMTVVDLADATETRQVVDAIVDVPGPVYLRLKRGEIPRIFGDGHAFSLTSAQQLSDGNDVALFASGMMLAAALATERILREHDVGVTVVYVPVIKPLDTSTVLRVAEHCGAVVSAENHLVTGGLGSAIAEVLAEAGASRRLHRVGLRDTFAEGAATTAYLFERHGLSTQHLIEVAWAAAGRTTPPPRAVAVHATEGEYAPV